MTRLGDWTDEQVVTLFCQAAVQSGLIEQEDVDFSINRLLELLEMEEPQQAASLVPILDLAERLIDCAVAKNLCEDSPEARDRFSAKLFGLVTPGPQAVREEFYRLMREAGSRAATDWFYRLCRANDYIRTRRIDENVRYCAQTEAGGLEITINLSKPEKDPRDIALARLRPSVGYPRCALCKENPGYAGRPGFPARHNHRIIPITLSGKPWYLQYSPYLYYEEHCIVLNREHVPMQMNRDSFERMFDFVDQFPHYFIGSNADLPIVGGSILTHDHFQGGRYEFPMERSETRFTFDTGIKGLSACALKWPMTCLKMESESRQTLAGAMDRVLNAWRRYSDEGLGIIARSGNTAHNAVTPVVRKTEKGYIAYLLLRNNITTDEHPLGVFHPHAEYHHIKKENIGLIEAMGLFILPGRLKKELAQVEEFLAGEAPLPPDSPHRLWVKEICDQLPEDRKGVDIGEYIRVEVAKVCCELLHNTGVFKQDAAGEKGLKRFLKTVF